MCEEFVMKRSGTIWVIALAAIAPIAAPAQSQTEGSAAPSAATSSNLSSEGISRADLDRLNTAATTEHKKWSLRNLVTHPIKTIQPKRLLGEPVRILKSLNPFAPV